MEHTPGRLNNKWMWLLEVCFSTARHYLCLICSHLLQCFYYISMYMYSGRCKQCKILLCLPVSPAVLTDHRVADSSVCVTPLASRRARTRRRSPSNLRRPSTKWSPYLRTVTPGPSAYRRVRSAPDSPEKRISHLCICVAPIMEAKFCFVLFFLSSQWPRSASGSCSPTSSLQGRLNSTPDTNTSWWSARCAAGWAPLQLFYTSFSNKRYCLLFFFTYTVTSIFFSL